MPTVPTVMRVTTSVALLVTCTMASPRVCVAMEEVGRESPAPPAAATAQAVTIRDHALLCDGRIVNPRCLLAVSGPDGSPAHEMTATVIRDWIDDRQVYPFEDRDGFIISLGRTAGGPDDEAGFVSYRVVGQTSRGVMAVVVGISGGGSGVFTDVLLLRLSDEPYLDHRGIASTRTILSVVGDIGLGDRANASVALVKDQLIIGRETSYHTDAHEPRTIDLSHFP